MIDGTAPRLRHSDAYEMSVMIDCKAIAKVQGCIFLEITWEFST